MSGSYNSLIDFLQTEQLANGSFSSISGNKQLTVSTKSQTTFHTSLILLCLAPLKDDPRAKKIIGKGINYLLEQKGADWTWNYWGKGTEKHIPPDWDDTSCALAALSVYKPEHINGAALRTITEHLMVTEIKTGGPYSTWIVSQNIKEKWHDDDVVVNSNIGFFLKLQNISLPNLAERVETYLKGNGDESKYYFSGITTAYFISRSYAGGAKNVAIDSIFKKCTSSGTWSDELETALAISTLLRFGVSSSKLKKAAAYLEKISKEKKWKARALYIEEKHGEPTYSGSETLTAAFCLEALALYDEQKKREQHSPKKQTENTSEIQSEIIKKTLAYFSFSPAFQKKAEAYIQKLTTKDVSNQITLLPYAFFRSTLFAGKRQKTGYRLVTELGVANLLGWLAYRIYDDILDNEGHPGDIPLANICLREITQIFSSDAGTEQRKLFNEIMSGIEMANAWERKTCYVGITNNEVQINELPDYEDLEVLAHKSFGHALGPFVILLQNGFSVHGNEMKLTRDFFHHYIIARQYNDDAHDWFSDLERGFLNAASTELLKSLKQAGNPLKINISESRQNLQSVFWRKTIITVAHGILDHVEKAREALLKNKALAETTYLESLLAPIEEAATKALHTRKQMLEFLGASPSRQSVN